MKEKKELPPNYEVLRKIRRDWQQVKPYTRIEEDKRKKKPKHKECYDYE